MTGSWHLDDDLLDSYAEGRALTPALSASVEAHLERCGQCQGRLVPAADLPRLDAVWAEVVEVLDAPRAGLLERLLLRVGVASDTARLVALTPSLSRSWTTGVVLVLTLALLVSSTGERGLALFLALAPVLPVAGIAVAFGPRSDPMHEVALAAPYSSFRLLLVRSAAVLAVTAVLAVPATLLVPSTPLVAAAWLLPALALAVTSLALATRIDPVASSAALSGGWLLLALSGLAPDRDPLVVASVLPQLLCLVLLVVSGAVLLRSAQSPTVSGSPA